MSVEARRAKMAQRLRPFGQAQEGTASEYVSDWEDTLASESKNTREGEDVSSLSGQDLLERQRKDYESVEKAIGFLGKAVTSLGKKI